MKSGYTIAYESIDEATNVILKITTSDGLTGWGCAAPDMEITNETADDVIAHIENLVIPLLMGQDPFQILWFHKELKTQNSAMRSTLAMVNIALYDLMSRKAGLPLYQLLGGYRKKIQTSITIGIEPLDETLRQAKEYWRQGFRILKLKGGLNLDEDISFTDNSLQRTYAGTYLQKEHIAGLFAENTLKLLKDKLTNQDRLISAF